MEPLNSAGSMLGTKGFNPRFPYVGIVVDDNDPAKLGRIRVRLPKINDQVPDDKLYWAIPRDWHHPEGLRGGEGNDRTGTYGGIPTRGSKVALYFPTGSPSIITYSQHVPLDMQNTLPEFEKNYPFRQGKRLSNGHSEIIDTRTNEHYRTNPGDVYDTVMGDRFQTVIGNDQTIVSSSKSDIPDYVRNSPLALDNLSPFPQKRVQYKGQGGTAGNKHLEIEGNLSLNVGGDILIDCAGKIEAKAGSSITGKAGGKITFKGTRIDLN